MCKLVDSCIFVVNLQVYTVMYFVQGTMYNVHTGEGVRPMSSLYMCNSFNVKDTKKP